MIRKLVGFPTVSRDSNLELIDFVREYLKPLDADVRLTFDDDKRKANLFATLGPRARGRHRAVGAYRCGAGAGPGVGQRSVYAAWSVTASSTAAAPPT